MGLAFKIFGTTIVTFVVLYFVGRTLFRWLRRVVERRIRADLIRRGYRLDEETPDPSIGIPVVAALSQILLLISVSDVTDARHGPLLVMLGAAGSMLVAFTLHGLPRHDRGLKYLMVWTGFFLVGTILTAEKGPAAHWALMVLPMALLAGTAVAVMTRGRIVEPGLTEFAIHRLGMILSPGPGLRAAATFFGLRAVGAFPFYLVVRYFTRPIVARRPFLYLRSFHDPEARAFFGKVLAPSVGTSGVLLGLVHQDQTGEDLHRDTPQAWLAEITALPDTAWQPWVSHKLARSAGVVIDVSIATDSVRWELAEALRVLPAHRVLVVSRAEIPADIAALGVSVLQYQLGTKVAQSEARRVLSSWTREVIAGTSAGPAGVVTRASAASPPIPRQYWLAAGAVTALAVGSLYMTVGQLQYLSKAAGGASEALFAAFGRFMARALTVQYGLSVAAMAMLAFAAPIFVLHTSTGKRVPSEWMIGACVVAGVLSLLLTGPQPETQFAVVDALRGVAIGLALGYALVAAAAQIVSAGDDLQLERLVPWLLAPGIGLLITEVLVGIAMMLQSRGLLMVVQISLVATYAVGVFAAGKLLLRVLPGR